MSPVCGHVARPWLNVAEPHPKSHVAMWLMRIGVTTYASHSSMARENQPWLATNVAPETPCLDCGSRWSSEEIGHGPDTVTRARSWPLRAAERWQERRSF